MHWLDPLNAAVEELAREVSPTLLARSAENLSMHYRSAQGSGTDPRADPLFPLAYSITRLPATASAIEFVLRKARERLPELQIESALDLGAGPGTSQLPLALHWPEIRRTTSVESHPGMSALGIKIASKLGHKSHDSSHTLAISLPATADLPPHELVLMSYLLNELPEQKRETLLRQAWQAAGKLLVIIEPGTPVGFENLIRARDLLIGEKANIIAPCPHHEACPLHAAKQSWCHFSVRLPRTRRHRLAKGAELGWEDEKFCYLVLGRNLESANRSCIISRPAMLKPGIELPLCTKSGLEKRLIRRSDPNRPAARRAEWGDFWD